MASLIFTFLRRGRSQEGKGMSIKYYLIRARDVTWFISGTVLAILVFGFIFLFIGFAELIEKVLGKDETD